MYNCWSDFSCSNMPILLKHVEMKVKKECSTCEMCMLLYIIVKHGFLHVTYDVKNTFQSLLLHGQHILWFVRHQDVKSIVNCVTNCICLVSLK